LAAKLYEEVNYCIRCGHPLILAERFGGVRPVCEACGWVYFADPKVAVAALIENDGRVFLVRRANDPQRGLWTLPAGFVDAGEDPVKAIERECREETGLEIRVVELLDVLYGQEHPRGAHILIVYRVEVISGDVAPADDVDRAAFFHRQELPPLAFSTTEKILASFSSLT
jgi:8-oxo-dGTP diphosphatase